MYTGSLTDKEYGEYNELKPQLSFASEVNGRELTVAVINQLNHAFNEGDYQFTLRKIKNLWNAGSKGRVSPETIDSEIARNVSVMIEAHQ